MALIEVRLRPAGPWRVGHHSGDRERVDTIYRSDALYSALTLAMRALGWLEEWLDATARAPAEPAVRFSSLFPFVGKTRLIAPPKNAWPPPNPGKLYLSGMRLVPLEIARGGTIDETRWTPDGASQCLIPAGAQAPFHVSLRSAAAVDRLTGAAETHRTACLEFAPNAGWWGLFDAVDAIWESRVKSAFRLLADSGFGGERSRGWGRAGEPQFSTAAALFPQAESNGSWWLLSLYSPHESDSADWSKGEYSAVIRGGWADNSLKRSVRMIEEGSVIQADTIRGRAVDVAPEGFPHAVYRWGIALAVPCRIGAGACPEGPPEEPTTVAESEQAEPPVPPFEATSAATPVVSAGRQAEAGDPASVAESEQAEPPVPPSGAAGAPTPAVSAGPQAEAGYPASVAESEQAEPPVPPSEAVQES